MSRITDIAKTMKTWWDEDDDAFVQSALDEIIRIDREQLPTIEPKRGKADRPQGWTPCSERQPTREGHYLCSFKKPRCVDNIYVDLAYWTGGRWYGYVALEIKAWMPLPAPWKGADDE